MSQVMEEEIEHAKFNVDCAALAGGMLAEEVTKKSPICADVGSNNIKAATIICNLLESDTFKLYPHNDLIGIELAGYLKNVTAIGAGIIDGYGLAVSTKSTYI